jgi:hypothetical protein
MVMSTRNESMRSGSAVVMLIAAALIGPAAWPADMAAERNGEQREESLAALEQKLEAARRRLDEAAQEIARLTITMEGNSPGLRWLGAGGDRAMLGINMSPLAAQSAPSDGVEIVSVSPGGPAAQAGLRAGDVLTETKGKSLKREGDESPRDKLIDAMRGVKPGEKVAVTYRRNGKTAQATIVAQPLADRWFASKPPLPMGPTQFRSFGTSGSVEFMRMGGVFGSAELAPLTPKLGQYFGTEKGLLVVRAPQDGRLQLEDGDVIVDIDGRTPSSAGHALRILASYQPGEKLRLNVLRARKKMSIEVTIPEDGTWERPAHGVEQGDFLVPAPPAAAMPLQVPSPAIPIIPLPAADAEA